ncbi:MAG: DUF4242 domain-containing protein [Sphingobacteriales bacterium]|nr:DUF4242 domain-containing protein [Sphingobacteriales bacterium]
MNPSIYPLSFIFLLNACASNSQQKQADENNATAAVAQDASQASYYIDVHNLEPGKVKFEDVANAHQKDLATEGRHGVNFIRYWVDEAKGKVYCLSKASNKQSIIDTHREAHGLLPDAVFKVTDGPEAVVLGNKPMYIDIHELGAGKVTAKDVAGAHEKDLAVEKKYGVNFINYWVDEKEGMILCLSEAPDSAAIKQTHKEAHGLLPAYILQVKQGQ